MLENFANKLASKISELAYGKLIKEFPTVPLSKGESLTFLVTEKNGRKRLILRVLEKERGEEDAEHFDVDPRNLDQIIQVLQEVRDYASSSSSAGSPPPPPTGERRGL